MVFDLRKSFARRAALALNGMLLPLSPPSSWQPTITPPNRSLATATRTKTMTPHLTTTTPKSFYVYVKRTGSIFFFSVFFLFMLPPVSYVEGTSLSTSLRYQADADPQLVLRCFLKIN